MVDLLILPSQALKTHLGWFQWLQKAYLACCHNVGTASANNGLPLDLCQPRNTVPVDMHNLHVYKVRLITQLNQAVQQTIWNNF